MTAELPKLKRLTGDRLLSYSSQSPLDWNLEITRMSEDKIYLNLTPKDTSKDSTTGNRKPSEL